MNKKEQRDFQFPAFGKKEWIKKINEQLSRKGNTYQDLCHEVEPGLLIEPFYHYDEEQPRTTPIDWLHQTWQSGAFLIPEFIKEELSFYRNPEPDYFLLSAAIFADQGAISLASPIPLHLLHDGFVKPSDLKIYPSQRNIFHRTADVQAIAYPGSFIWVNHPDYQKNYSEQLFLVLDSIISNLSQISREDLEEGRLIITVGIGHSYLEEMAKIRALKLLLKNVWKAFHLRFQTLPQIEAIIDLDPYEEDGYQQIISQSIRSLAAVSAGVDRLAIVPKFEPERDKYRRNGQMALDIHHILKLESFLDQVIDPAAGSYFLEELTSRIAQKSWKKVQEKGLVI